MTLEQLHDILVERVGWDNDKTVKGFALSTENSTALGNTYFQDEHTAVTLQNIKDCQPNVNISATEFNDYLLRLKSKVVRQVLSDCFERDTVNDNLITLYPRAFDVVIRMRMVIYIGELIITTGRSNPTSRFTKGFIGKLHYDIFRDSVQKFANRASTYKYAMAIATRYQFELQSVQRRFGTQRNMMRTITKGQAQ